MTEKLTQAQIELALLELNASLPENQQWKLQDGKITKTFLFKSFIRAFGWMSQMAIW
ncbi:MAG TPA: 4a-hydroxytetrahydrobiopterin dehydratase, partial [Glaciecola sp.]|nr:4a-hydroxytetrahydrobiopterin dehydratase [Glaciecola sp.]